MRAALRRGTGDDQRIQVQVVAERQAAPAVFLPPFAGPLEPSGAGRGASTVGTAAAARPRVGSLSLVVAKKSGNLTDGGDGDGDRYR